MTKDDARKKLEDNLKQMREQRSRNEAIEDELTKATNDNGRVSGPKNDIDYQKMRKDIKESGKDEK